MKLQVNLTTAKPDALARSILEMMIRDGKSRGEATRERLKGRKNRFNLTPEFKDKVSQELNRLLNQRQKAMDDGTLEPCTSKDSQRVEIVHFTDQGLIRLVHNASDRNEKASLENERLANEYLDHINMDSLLDFCELRKINENLKKVFDAAGLDFKEVLKERCDLAIDLTDPDQCIDKLAHGMLLVASNPEMALGEIKYEELDHELLYLILSYLNREERKMLLEGLFLAPQANADKVSNLISTLIKLIPYEPSNSEEKEALAKSEISKEFREEVYAILQEIGNELFDQLVKLKELREEESSDDDSHSDIAFIDDEAVKFDRRLDFEADRQGVLIYGVDGSIFNLDTEKIIFLYQNALVAGLRQQAGSASTMHSGSLSDNELIGNTFLEDIKSEDPFYINTLRKYDAVGFYTMLCKEETEDTLLKLLSSDEMALKYGAFRALTQPIKGENWHTVAFLNNLEEELKREEASFSLTMLIILSNMNGYIDKDVGSHYTELLKLALSIEGIDFAKAVSKLDDINIPIADSNGDPETEQSDSNIHLLVATSSLESMLHKCLGIEKLLEFTQDRDSPTLAKNAQAILSLFKPGDIQLFLLTHPNKYGLLAGADISNPASIDEIVT